MKTYTQPPPWKNDPSSSTTRPLGNRHALVENLNAAVDIVVSPKNREGFA